MLGERSEQRGLWEADRLYIDHVGRGSFYGLLASMRGQLFRDEEFAELYCADNGRDSVPPSLGRWGMSFQQTARRSSPITFCERVRLSTSPTSKIFTPPSVGSWVQPANYLAQQRRSISWPCQR